MKGKLNIVAIAQLAYERALHGVVPMLAAVGILFSLSGCTRDPEVINLNGPAQLVRSRVFDDFAKNPVWARRKYSALFEQESSGGRNQVVAMLVACMSVESNGLPIYHGCRDFVGTQLKSSDAEIRGIALSMLIVRNDRESIAELLKGYDEPDDAIHMPAASALQGRLDSLKWSADRAALIELSGRILPHCGPGDSSIGERLCAEVASNVR